MRSRPKIDRARPKVWQQAEVFAIIRARLALRNVNWSAQAAETKYADQCNALAAMKGES